ncbi:MAG: capsule assembly Wzi family protein [Cyclobacteriaceae bacterium]
MCANVKFLLTVLLSIISLFGDAQIQNNLTVYPNRVDTTSVNLFKSIIYEQENYFKTHDLTVKSFYNSAYPRGFNDGPTWKGKGLTLEAQGGFSGQKGRLSYTLYPTVFYSQNVSFSQPSNTTGAHREHRYPFATIDWVQSYGDGAFVYFHPGQSELKMQWGKFSASLSTQNYSAGPAIHNPIILSRQAGGFPHVRLGSEPFDLKIKNLNTGKWDVNFLFGLLRESDYFDNNSKNNHRYFNGMFIAYQPSFLPELTIAFNRGLYKDTQFFETQDLFSTIHIFDTGTRGDSIDTNDTFDQLASLSFTWTLPKSGFRAYLEFARNDFSGKFVRFLKEPEHSRAYTIGFSKSISTANGKTVLISYEHTNLSRNHTFLYQPEPPYYIHNINKQGYTHDGQILGAGIGPGGNSGHLNVRIQNQQNIMGFLFERIEYNKDYFVVNIQDRLRHNIEYSLGFNLQKELPAVTYGFESILSYNFNHNFQSNKLNLYLALASRIKLDR